MAKRIRFISFIALVLGSGTVTWSAFAAAPAQSSAVELSNTGCTDPPPEIATADIRWIGGG